jgi:hypothetical protein
MRFIVQQRDFRMIYNHLDNAPKHEQDVFRLALYFNARELKSDNASYHIEHNQPMTVKS